jgi:hypothetical protein
VGEIDDARAEKRLVANYQACVSHGPERVYGLVPAGSATGLHQGNRERVARVSRI